MIEGKLFEAFSEVSMNNDGKHKKSAELVGLIIKEQEALKDKEMWYIRPYFTIRSKLKKAEIENNTLRITMNWKDKKGVEIGAEFEFDMEDLNIEVNNNNKFVNLSQNLGGNFIKQFTIFF